MPEDENYVLAPLPPTHIEKAIRETEELICDAERELERLRRQLSWLIEQRPRADEAEKSFLAF